MRITIAHSKSRQQTIEAVDRAVEDALRSLAQGPVQITDLHKEWQGSMMTFSLTAKMGFLKTPVSGTAEVTDRDIIVTADVGLLAKFLPSEKVQAALETRLRGLLG